MLTAAEIPADDAGLLQALERHGLVTSDLGYGGNCFFRFADAGTMIGYAGVELHGRDAMLRSVVAMATGRGDGSRIVDAVLGWLAARDVAVVWLLTQSAAAFFGRHGFVPVARGEVPASIAANPQFTGLCPGSATCMRRQFAGSHGEVGTGSPFRNN